MRRASRRDDAAIADCGIPLELENVRRIAERVYRVPAPDALVALKVVKDRAEAFEKYITPGCTMSLAGAADRVCPCGRHSGRRCRGRRSRLGEQGLLRNGSPSRAAQVMRTNSNWRSEDFDVNHADFCSRRLVTPSSPSRRRRRR